MNFVFFGYLKSPLVSEHNRLSLREILRILGGRVAIRCLIRPSRQDYSLDAVWEKTELRLSSQKARCMKV
jgi:hypothetical protein